jgi:hypothetical protein
MKQIALSKEHFALVDDCDYEFAAKFKWKADKRPNGIYVKRYIEKTVKGVRDRRVEYLHRVLLGVTDPKVLVDHGNGNPLDCQRKNLRLCSHAENGRNARRGKNNIHGFKGLMCRPSGRWGAYITFNRKNICLGTFDTKEEAARRYDEGARFYHGTFANLNFPEQITTP